MVLQTRDMVMQGLGVLGDAPPSSLQPPLVDGVHLRWAFPPEHGFPLHGFYLFRRSHREGSPEPLSGVTGGLQPGPLPNNRLDTPLGEISSDVNLVLRDDFPPSGTVEFDLDGRDHLRFELPEGEPARRVEVRIGFRKRPGEPPPAKRCVSFTNRPNETGSNPRTEQGVMFETLDQHGRPRPHTYVRERQIQGGKISGLDCEWELVITLPEVSSSVELTLTPLGSPATLEAYNEDGSSAGTATTGGNRRRPETLRLTGRAINRVVVRARQTPPNTQTLLNQICFERVATPRIRLTALLGDVPVVSADVEGRPGDIVPQTLEFDAISAVEIEGGPAALVELGIVPVSQDATVGWELIPDFTYPMRLPVTHPDYPCTPGQGENLQAARDLARNRVLYGDPGRLVGAPTSVHSAGTVAVAHGSPVVVGLNTDWELDLAGEMLRIAGDTTAYGIADVLAPDKLVLTRPYAGSTGSGRSYAVEEDSFGQIHDHMVNLVAGGSAAGSLMDRFLPNPAYVEGTIALTGSSATVMGSGTAWDARLKGLALRLVESSGTVSVRSGSRVVDGSWASGWGSELIGRIFEVAGEREAYTIERVDSGGGTLAPRLILDRPYEGSTGAGKAYAATEKETYGVEEVNSPTQLTLNRPYDGVTGGGRGYSISAWGFRAVERGESVPLMSRQYSQDLVLLSALHPAMAQIAGLYWVDRKAQPGVAYDYLLVADHDGHGELDPAKMLSFLEQNGFDSLDAYIASNERAAPSAPLPVPADVRVYALPDGGLDASASAGLRWELGKTEQGELLPRSPITYHLWRAGPSNRAPNQPPSLDGYELRTKDPLTNEPRPLLVADAQLPAGAVLQQPPDWPPFRMHAIDGPLQDGWYSYRVSGIDIFGRYSQHSDAGPWYQWAPVPEPRPWYYEDPPAERPVHPFAINVPDRLAPPPPTGIEAYALDPEDPTVIKDAAYQAWQGALTGAQWYRVLPDSQKLDLIGLRVRWLWTETQREQAPDTREFRIYYREGTAGQMNALLGETRIVTAAGATDESTVETDIPNTLPADAYMGASLRVGQDVFAIVSSEAGGSTPGTPLKLTVKNVGPTGSIRPPAGAPCAIAIPPLYTEGSVSVETGSATVTGTGTNWTGRLVGMPMRVARELAEYTVARVDSPTRLALDRPYAETTDDGRAYGIRHPLFVDYGTPTNWEERYYVVGYDDHVRERIPAKMAPEGRPLLGSSARVSGSLITLDGEPDLSGVEPSTDSLFLEDDTASARRIYRLVAIANAANTVTVEGTPNVGTGPSPWIIGPPQLERVYEVFLPTPDGSFRRGLPISPSLAEPIAYANIGVSAADDKDYVRDAPKWEGTRWGNRPGNEGRVGPPARVFRVLREEPEPPTPPPDAQRVFATPADYYGRSYYTYRWRPAAHLKTHVFRALDDALFKTDWVERRSRQPLSPLQTQFFPSPVIESRWDSPKRQQVANELNRLDDFGQDVEGAMAYYRGLSNDALRVLAGLPGNERAFTQLTIQPLDPDDPANADRRGPDSPDGYVPNPNLRAYEDTLDGRSTNCYFYRAAYVDGAHNRSRDLSLSSPAVYLPNVVPPHAPATPNALGGDRRITLSWASNREPDLAGYLVFRTDDREATRDTRLMSLVHTETVQAGDPTARPAEVTWIDQAVPALTTLYYRVMAFSSVGIASLPSPAAASRAFDDARPAPPTWSTAEPGPAPNSIRLRWASAVPNLRSLVQRRIVDTALWENISGWLDAGVYAFVDSDRAAGLQYVYRLRVMDAAGKTNNEYNELTF
jgi:hypothetical protein